MATIESIAIDHDMTAYGLRAFAGDLLDGVADDFTALPEDVENELREALGRVPAED